MLTIAFTLQHEGNVKALRAAGGVNGLLKGLNSSRQGLAKGVPDRADRVATYGVNHMSSPDPKSWLELFIAVSKLWLF